MRVLLTADTVGGVWTYALELARALARHEVEIALATMGAPLSPEQHIEAGRLRNVELFESRFRLEWMEAPWDDVERAGEWLLGIEERLQPDVVHLNGFAHGALPWQAPTLVVGHSCVLSWWEAVKGAPAPAQWDRYRGVVTRGLRAADLVVAPTRTMLDALDAHYGPFTAATVVPNGRERTLFPPGREEPLVLAAGRLWDEAKNIGALSAVAPCLPWPICIAGDNEHPDGGERARHDNVHLLGRLPPPTLADWLARAAIYALPARYEPFGLSALEAGLAGCALVLGDIPSLREVWGDAARFVPPDDTDALRATLCSLIADATHRGVMAARARNRAMEFTPERMATGYLGLYQYLMTTKNPSLRAREGAFQD